MPTEKPRLTLTVPEEQYDRIKDYQYSRRMKNQTQAILNLIYKGLEIELSSEQQESNAMIQDVRAQLMGDRFEQLDDTDKDIIYKIAGVLLEQGKYGKSPIPTNVGMGEIRVAARGGVVVKPERQVDEEALLRAIADSEPPEKV